MIDSGSPVTIFTTKDIKENVGTNVLFEQPLPLSQNCGFFSATIGYRCNYSSAPKSWEPEVKKNRDLGNGKKQTDSWTWLASTIEVPIYVSQSNRRKWMPFDG